MQKTTGNILVGGESNTGTCCTEMKGTLAGISGKNRQPAGNSEGPQLTDSNKVNINSCHVNLESQS